MSLVFLRSPHPLWVTDRVNNDSTLSMLHKEPIRKPVLARVVKW